MRRERPASARLWRLVGIGEVMGVDDMGMSATEVLRRMLDERGVENEGGGRSLRWRDRYGIMMQAFPLANGELGMGVWSCTPEQAIAATLGPGTWSDFDMQMAYHMGYEDALARRKPDAGEVLTNG